MYKLFLISALLFTLAACAPATKGSSAMSAFDSRTELISVQAANAYYASYRTSPQTFGLNHREFGAAVVSNPRVGKKITSNITGRFAVMSTTLPEDWSANIVSAKVVKEVKSVSRRSVSYYYWLDLTFKVDVPAGAELGVHREMVSVKPKGGQEKEIPLNFFVRKTQALR